MRAIWKSRRDLGLEERRELLWSYLGEGVRAELWCHEADTQGDPENILALLHTIYGEKRSCAQLMGILHQVVQTPNEPVRTYSHRLQSAFRALIARQKELNVSETDASFLRDYFAENLYDPQVKRQIQELLFRDQQVTFLTLRDAAIRWAGDESPAMEHTGVSAVNARQMFQRQSRQLPTPAGHQANSDVDQLKEDMAVLKLQMAELLTKSSSPRTPRGKIQCYNCREEGHIARRCPKKVSPQ